MKRTHILAALALAFAASPGSFETKAQTNAMNSFTQETTAPAALNERAQSFVRIAAYEAKGDTAGLGRALNDILDRDALTVAEAKEALSQLYAYTGFPRSLNGLGTLSAVVEQRKADGKSVNEGREATPLPEGYDALKQGTEVQSKLTGRAYNYAFAPATDYYLKAHLFGDIFARDVLSHADRELVTVSALASLKDVEPQLRAHTAGALRMGVTEAQLRALPDVLRAEGLALEAWRAARAVAQTLGEPATEGKPVENQIFPQGTPNTAYAQYFIGNSYLAPYQVDGIGMANVTFEPGCRNNWHIHHGTGQILVCVGGEGWYQAWGQPAQRLHPGDVVNIPAEVKHWHGAARDQWFQHIAISVPREGASNEWLEPVEDAAYNQLP